MPWDFLNIFLDFSLFILFNVYLVRFKTNKKRHFLTYILTYVSNFKEKMLNFNEFRNFEKSAYLKIAAQAFEGGDFLNIFLRFPGFWGTFSYKNFSYKKRWITNDTKHFCGAKTQVLILSVLELVPKHAKFCQVEFCQILKVLLSFVKF